MPVRAATMPIPRNPASITRVDPVAVPEANARQSDLANAGDADAGFAGCAGTPATPVTNAAAPSNRPGSNGAAAQ